MSAGIVMILVGCVSLAAGATALIFWTATFPGRYRELERRLKGKY